MKQALEGKYGKPAKPGIRPLDDCTTGETSCLVKGRVRRSASWRWPEGQTLELALDGGAPGGAPRLTLVYGDHDGDQRRRAVIAVAQDAEVSVLPSSCISTPPSGRVALPALGGPRGALPVGSRCVVLIPHPARRVILPALQARYRGHFVPYLDRAIAALAGRGEGRPEASCVERELLGAV